MINTYLKILLADNKRVIIPDFGGFVVKRSAAGDIISFNSFLKFNDDLLLNLIVEKEGIDKMQALKKIKDFVGVINTSLDNQGKYEIEAVGYLIKDKKENIRFVEDVDTSIPPSVANEVTTQEAEVADEASRESETIEVEENSQSSEEVQEEDQTLTLTEPITEPITDSSEVQSEEPAKDRTRSKLWIVLIVILLLLGFWAVSHHIRDTKHSTNQTELVEGDKTTNDVADQIKDQHNKYIAEKADAEMNERLSSNDKSFFAKISSFFKGLFRKKKEAVAEPVEVVQEQAPKSVMQPNQVDTINGIIVVADENISPKGKERYNVIIGAFSESENATQYNKALRDDEYASEIFTRNNGFKAVSMGAYPSLDIALRVCGEKLEQTPDIWILVK